MSNAKDKPFFLFAEISPKRYFIYWLWSIFFFIVLGLVGFLFNNNSSIWNTTSTTSAGILFLFILVDVFLGIVFFIGAVISFSYKVYLRKIYIDKWYVLAIITVIVFACLFYFKITNDNEIKQKEETITVMKCLQLGSDNARIACIKKYKPVQ